MSLSGGCQCGAVRFRVDGDLGRASLCHCRMCQKATGGPFGLFVTVRSAELTWTRGEPKRFQSSNMAERGFCECCGTPLTYEWSPDKVELAVAAFDRAGQITPTIQLAAEDGLPWIGKVADIPHPGPEEARRTAEAQARIRSHQHPDHDTTTWTPGWGHGS